MLEVDRLIATNAERHRCMSTPNQSRDSGFGIGITSRREKTRKVLGTNSIILSRRHANRGKVAAELRITLHFEVSKKGQETE